MCASTRPMNGTDADRGVSGASFGVPPPPPLLQIIFVLALAHLAGAKAGLADQITTVACAAVLGVSLLYDVMLIATAQSAALGGWQTTTALVAYGLFVAVEHMSLVGRPCSCHSG